MQTLHSRPSDSYESADWCVVVVVEVVAGVGAVGPVGSVEGQVVLRALWTLERSGHRVAAQRRLVLDGTASNLGTVAGTFELVVDAVLAEYKPFESACLPFAPLEEQPTLVSAVTYSDSLSVVSDLDELD